MRLFNEFERDVIKRFEQYQVPVIELKKEAISGFPKEHKYPISLYFTG